MSTEPDPPAARQNPELRSLLHDGGRSDAENKCSDLRPDYPSPANTVALTGQTAAEDRTGPGNEKMEDVANPVKLPISSANGQDRSSDESRAEKSVDADSGKEAGPTGSGRRRTRSLVEERIVSEGFMFNRRRPENPVLPKDTVTVLSYPFPPATIPMNEDENEFRAALAAAKVYLVGSAHFSLESQQDVLTTIENTQPDSVMVELCASRVSILSMNEATLLEENKNLNMEKVLATMKQCGVVQGILHVLLLSMSAHITRTLGVAPGGEFRAAYRGAMKTKMCRLILGDRPFQITIQRALNSLSFYQKMRLFYHIVMSHFNTITFEDVERCKKSDMLSELLKELAGEFPLMKEIFVEERDKYMTSTLHGLLLQLTLEKRAAWKKTQTALLAQWQPVTVVAVVGIGHVPGIADNWNKHLNVAHLLTIPAPTRTQKIVRLGFKTVFYGVSAYVAFRLGSMVVTKVHAFMKP